MLGRPYLWTIEKKHGRNKGHKRDIGVNVNDFAVNTAYISVTVNSKTLIVPNGDAPLFVHYA